MKSKKLSAAFVIAILTIFATASITPQAFADQGKSKCSLKAGCKYSSDKGREGNLSCKVFKKAHFLKENQAEIGLSDEQVDQIIDIKFALKKDLVMKKAEIEVVKLDIKRSVYERTVDVEAVNDLIDQKYAIKSEKSKATVQALADIKNILTDDQYEAMKSIWKNKKSKK